MKIHAITATLLLGAALSACSAGDSEDDVLSETELGDVDVIEPSVSDAMIGPVPPPAPAPSPSPTGAEQTPQAGAASPTPQPSSSPQGE